MQICPLLQSLKNAILRAASLRSASFLITAQLPVSPPSSSATGVRFFAASAMTCFATVGEPV